MPDDRTFDGERLEGRLEGVAESVRALESDLARLHRLATVGVAAGMVAHEIRGVMAPVKAYAQMASRSIDDRALVAKALARAEEGADRAVKIAESILALVGAAERSGANGSATVDEIVSRSLDALVRPPEKEGVQVRREIEPDLVAAIEPVELQQVVMNLVRNAVRAMGGERGSRGGGGVLTIAARSTWNGDVGTVVLEVRDTGPGLDPEVASRVFQPFVTAGRSAADRGESGSGLGLALCRQLIEHAGGRIGVESAPGRGATFRVELPAKA